MVKARRVDTTGTQVYMGTMTQGVDVHTALTDFARSHGIHTGTVQLLGGLYSISFAAYDFTTQTRLPPLVFNRALEIVGGHGTLSLLDDDLHIHLHLSVAFRETDTPHGISIVGGHVERASAYAVEFTLTAYAGNPIRRGLDPDTGLRLWDTSL